MSIINEALKKARREAGAKENLSEAERAESIIHPKKRIESKSNIQTVLPGFAMLFLFFGLLAGLSYFIYQEYFSEPESDPSPATVAKEAAPAPEEKEAPMDRTASPQSNEPESPTVTKPEGGVKPVEKPPAPPPVLTVAEPIPSPRPAPTPSPEPQTTPPPSSEPSVANVEILSQLEINGVMRGGSSARILTNSGVYRVGDQVRAPAGYIVEEIGEEQLILRSPEGDRYTLPLP